MTKVFISQPMKDKTNQEIEQERKKIIEKVERYFGEVEVIDSFFKDAPHDAKPLWFLGKSLELLSNANVIVLGKGWECSRGCRIEHECAIQYGISVIYIENL
ncbi:MAG: DUF4406 domain-containing protein [Clostridiales bacterium]|nr:DUF4406 domain-containing protein [Clostridiales bacterium]